MVSLRIGVLEAVCSGALWPLSGFLPVQMTEKIENHFLGGVLFAIVEDHRFLYLPDLKSCPEAKIKTNAS